MAKVYLDTNDTFVVASNNVQVFGTNGTSDIVTVQSGVTGLVLDQNVEKLNFSGATSGYRYQQAGNQLKVYSSDGTQLLASVPLQDDANGTQMVFSNGKVDVKLGTGGVMTFGGATVTSTISTVTPTTIDTSETSGGSGGTVGQTFTLTTGADISGTLVGSAGTTSTSGSDTFTATQSTYTTDDVLVGGEGTDTLTITATAAVGRASTVTGMDIINVNSSGVFAAEFDAAGVVAVGSTINVANSASGGSFNLKNLGTGATVGATGVSGALTIVTASQASQTLTVGANTASSQAVTLHGTSGTTDTATFTAAGTVALGTAGTSQIETVNLSGNGAAATYTITGQPTTINLTGSQSVTVSGAASDFTTKTLTDNTTAGTTTLKITTSGAADLSKTAADVLEIAADAGGHTYTVKAGQAIKVSTANTGNPITFDINDNTTPHVTGAVTVDLAAAILGTANKGISTDASASSDNINALTLTNNTVNQSFTLLAGAGADTAGSAVAVTVSGTKNLTLGTTSTAKSIDATGLSGVLTVHYDNAADIATVTGGSGNDVFTNATAAIGTQVTINGGAGNDTFTMLSGAKAVIDGGDGIADKVVLDGTVDATSLSLSNIEIISLTGTGAATFKASQLTGKAYVVTGDATADKIIIGGTNKEIDSATIDLSKLVLDTANVQNTEVTAAGSSALADTFGLGTALTVTGTAVIDTVDISGMSGTNTISTGGGNDVIKGGSGADSITSGEGQDVITPGAGNDTIILTESTPAIDKIVFATVADSDSAAQGQAKTGVNTIVGFGATDTLNIAGLGDGSTSGTGLVAVTSAGTQTAFTDDRVHLITLSGTGAGSLTTGSTTVLNTADLTAATLTNLATYLGERFTVAGDTAVEGVIVLNVGTTTSYIYQVSGDAVSGNLGAADIALVAIVGQSAALTADNLVYA